MIDLKKILILGFILGILARIIFIFTILPPYQLSNIPADYGAGVAQLINTGLTEFTAEDISIMKAADMNYFPYTTYWPYLPFTNYFRGFLVIASGHNPWVFDVFYIILIISADIAIFWLITKISLFQKISQEKALAAGLLYFLNPMTFDNLRWRSTNNFMVVMLMLALYFYLQRREIKATMSLAVSIALKILPVFILPAVILRHLPNVRKIAVISLIAVSLSVLTAIPTLMQDSGLFLKNTFLWGGGIHGGNLSDSVQFISFLTLLNVAGIGKEMPQILGAIFILIMLAGFLYAYWKFRTTDLVFQSLVVFTIFFLMHNIIETHHFVILFALFAANVYRSSNYTKWALAFTALPVLWYFATPTAFGTRFLAKIGVSPIPHEIIVIISILIIKASFVLVLWEAHKIAKNQGADNHGVSPFAG